MRVLRGVCVRNESCLKLRPYRALYLSVSSLRYILPRPECGRCHSDVHIGTDADLLRQREQPTIPRRTSCTFSRYRNGNHGGSGAKDMVVQDRITIRMCGQPEPPVGRACAAPVRIRTGISSAPAANVSLSLVSTQSSPVSESDTFPNIDSRRTSTQSRGIHEYVTRFETRLPHQVLKASSYPDARSKLVHLRLLERCRLCWFLERCLYGAQ